jgi:hypothetical protein
MFNKGMFDRILKTFLISKNILRILLPSPPNRTCGFVFYMYKAICLPVTPSIKTTMALERL